jgi:hypothetical protein
MLDGHLNMYFVFSHNTYTKAAGRNLSGSQQARGSEVHSHASPGPSVLARRAGACIGSAPARPRPPPLHTSPPTCAAGRARPPRSRPGARPWPPSRTRARRRPSTTSAVRPVSGPVSRLPLSPGPRASSRVACVPRVRRLPHAPRRDHPCLVVRIHDVSPCACADDGSRKPNTSFTKWVFIVLRWYTLVLVL